MWWVERVGGVRGDGNVLTSSFSCREIEPWVRVQLIIDLKGVCLYEKNGIRCSVKPERHMSCLSEMSYLTIYHR